MKEGRKVNRRQTTVNGRRRYIVFVLSIVYCLSSIVCGVAFGQDSVPTPSFKKYPFVHNDRNEIVNVTALDSFFHKLYLRRKNKNQKVNVLHIGDSHIQADMITAQLRTGIQKDFGNAGRGLIIPLRVANSNEPFSYKITSNVKWYGKRCVYVNDSLDYGIGGFVAKTSNDSAMLNLRVFDYPPLNYSFNRVTFFYNHDSSFAFSLYDTLGNKLATFARDSVSAFLNSSSVKLPLATNNLVIDLERNDSTQTHATIYGFNLENDSAGVLYHTVGVNGAEAYQYIAAKYFAEQTALLLPDVIFISLGTNEAQRRPFDRALTEARLDSLVKKLQACNPGASIVLTTPPDSYFHRKYYNTAVSTYHELTVEYAKQHNLAVWDLFAVTGGYKSAYQWKKYGLMRKDGVHFSRAGYELQGNLFYEALIKAYNKYVGH